jgi:hypothetical protein
VQDWEFRKWTKFGKLRQVSEPENGQVYWMVFGNRNQVVKAGNRVDIMIGDFRVEGIVVESLRQHALLGITPQTTTSGNPNSAWRL